MGIAEFYFVVKMQTRSAKILHESMLKSVMRSSIQFFESTPTGRILNRFSKDINSVEFPLLSAFKDVLYTLLDILNVIIVVSIIFPVFLIFMVIFAIGYVIVQVFKKYNVV